MLSEGKGVVANAMPGFDGRLPESDSQLAPVVTPFFLNLRKSGVDNLTLNATATVQPTFGRRRHTTRHTLFRQRIERTRASCGPGG